MKRRTKTIDAPARNAGGHDARHVLSVAQVLGIDIWLAILWIINMASFVPRQQMLLDYETLAGMPPWLEPLTVPPGWLIVLVVLAGTWWWRMRLLERTQSALSVRVLLGLSLLPLLLNLLRARWPAYTPVASIFEPLWAAALSGGVVYASWPAETNGNVASEPVEASAIPHSRQLVAFLEKHSTHLHYLFVGLSCAAAAAWWWYQSHQYYAHFMLGFNDFGHFAQRIAATAQGRGFLLESPVLPAYWDHFNPGLALLVPMWRLWPSVEMIFLIQAASLAGSGWLVARIALAFGASRTIAALWGVAWLLHPSVSQMNLAYTYGWHPVCLAIPCLLYAILKTIRRQHVAACIAAALACSMEETVLVIVAAYCAARAAGLWLLQRRNRTEPEGAGDYETLLGGGWKSGVWLSACISVVLLFVVVYRWSGMAPFQTARFVALGDSAWAILASPVLRPAEFWGQLLSYRNLAFLACLAIPLFPIAARSTWSIWIATLVPLSVLMVWDHDPAKSLAFHYPATILPIWVVAAVAGALHWRGGQMATAVSAASLVICLLLSKHLGQMPWTGPMLTDVIWSTYPAAGLHHRAPSTPAGQWLTERTETLRQRGEPVLATGRAAAHLIGCAEVETVGQFFERRERLQLLTPHASPLLRYRGILLDRTELFQQSSESIERLEAEAKSLGYRVVGEQHDIVELER